MLPLSQAAGSDSVTTLAGLIVWVISCRLIRILSGSIVALSLVSAFNLTLFLLRVQAEARIINALKEKVDITERLEVDNYFNDGAQRHDFTPVILDIS